MTGADPTWRPTARDVAQSLADPGVLPERLTRIQAAILLNRSVATVAKTMVPVPGCRRPILYDRATVLRALWGAGNAETLAEVVADLDALLARLRGARR